MKQSIILCAFLFVYSGLTAQTTAFLSENGSGANNGTSWSDAYPADSLQAAIDELSAIGGGEVWIQAGIYYPISVYDGDISDQRKKSLTLKSHVTVYGGFSGIESGINERNNFGEGEANETVISGDIGVLGDNSDNAYHVVYNESAIVNAGLNGLTISNGNANGSSGFVDNKGGGIYSRGELLIINCVIKNNESDDDGAGINMGAYSVCSNSVIHNNTGADLGGGIFLLYFTTSTTPEPLVENCLIYDNFSDYGGGVYASSGGIVRNSKIIGNQARYGAGVYLKNTGRADNNLLSHNEANFYGGGLYLYYGGEATGNTIVSNDANFGAGVYRRYGGIIQNSVMWNNSDQFAYYGSGDGIEYCAVEGGYTSSGAGSGIIELSTDNTGVGTVNYPEFRNPNTYQGHSTTLMPDFIHADWSFNCNSACIDTASSALIPAEITHDILGNNRVVDGNSDGDAKPDMGAFEYASEYAVDVTICEGDTYSFGGNELSSTGIYNDTLGDSFGCDSIVILNLTVIPIDSLIINESICEGDVFTYNGQDYSEAGTFFQNSPAPSGCDSVIEINISINPVDTTVLALDTIYGSQIYDFYGQNITSAGIYHHTTESVFGCDSVIEQTFEHLPVDTVLPELICDGDFYDFNGNILTTEGTYYHYMNSVASGDSVIQLDLTVRIIDTTLLAPVYLGATETYDFHGNVINSPGTYYHTFPSAEGCDSILQLDVFPRKYVRQNGSGLQNGNNWANAYPDYKLQDAINDIAGYGGGQVWVAKGTYKPTTSINRGISFIMYENVELYGGFNGNEDSISQRNNFGLYQGNETKLSGDINTLLDTSDNSYVIIKQANDFYCLIDGFTIKDASHPGFTAEAGGVHLKEGGILRNSVVINNYAGYVAGGVLNDGGIIDNCIIKDNRTDGYAGGVLLNSGQLINSEITGNITDNGGAGVQIQFDYSLVENCQFTNNTIYEYGWGGAISLEGNADSVLITNCTFSNNQAILGGAIYMSNSASGLIIDDCVFTNNEAIDYLAQSTGTIYDGTAGAVMLQQGVVKNCTFEENQATLGGAVALYNNAVVESSMFFNNHAVDNGGAVYLYQNGTVENCDLLNNSAEYGAGVYIHEGGDIISSLIKENAASQDGGGVFTKDNGLIENCEISSNTARYGAGAYFSGGGFVNRCKIVNNHANYNGGGVYNFKNQDPILNSYIFNNSVNYDGGGVYNDASNTLTCEVYNSLIFNNHAGRNGAGVFFYFGGKLVNSNLVRNSADDDGGGTYIREKGKVFNSVIWGNNTQIFTLGTNTQLVIDTTAVEGGYTGTGAGNIIIDIDTLNNASTPANYADFVNPPSFIGNASSTADSLELISADWNLNCGSALIDQGNNNLLLDTISVDVLGKDRYFDGDGNSIATVDIGAVEADYNYSLDVMLCEGDVFTLGSQSITEEGVYTESMSSVDGCDSVLTAHVFIVPIDTVQVTEYICQGDNYDFNGTLLDVAGNYTETFPSSMNCDSVVELTLIVLPIDTTELNESICDGNTYSFFGTDLDTPGTYEHTLPNQSGCDSTIILYLTVNPVYEFIENHAICDGEVYTWQGADYSTAGTYYSTHTTLHGCDSVYELNLMIQPLPETPEISINGETLISDAEQGNQWYLDDNEIDDATSNSYFPELNGDYFVVVTDENGCISDTSNVIFVNWLGFDSHSSIQITVYPNPFKERLIIESDCKDEIYYELISLSGKHIKSGVFTSSTTINTTNLKPSVYLLKLNIDGVIKAIKVVK